MILITSTFELMVNCCEPGISVCEERIGSLHRFFRKLNMRFGFPGQRERSLMIEVCSLFMQNTMLFVKKVVSSVDMVNTGSLYWKSRYDGMQIRCWLRLLCYRFKRLDFSNSDQFEIAPRSHRNKHNDALTSLD